MDMDIDIDIDMDIDMDMDIDIDKDIDIDIDIPASKLLSSARSDVTSPLCKDDCLSNSFTLSSSLLQAYSLLPVAVDGWRGGV